MKEQRTCIACRKKTNKSELYRIVLDLDDSVKVDEKQKENARGLYICKSEKCISKLIKMKNKSKILKSDINEDKFKEVLNKLGENLNWEK